MSDDNLNTQKLSWKNILKGVAPFAIMILAVILIRSFILGSFNIPSGSMENTLMPGDIAVVNYLDKDPKQGDVIVFSDDERWLASSGHSAEGDHLIKRVAAVGGDTIESKNGEILVNGEPWETKHILGTNIDFPEQKVPANHYFVLGDNREYSADSRYHIETGSQFISKESVVGRAFFAITFPWLSDSQPLNLRPLTAD